MNFTKNNGTWKDKKQFPYMIESGIIGTVTYKVRYFTAAEVAKIQSGEDLAKFANLPRCVFDDFANDFPRAHAQMMLNLDGKYGIASGKSDPAFDCDEQWDRWLEDAAAAEFENESNMGLTR